MLSVLIPTYNWNVVPLVEELNSQLEKAKTPFEIIVFDDATKSELNSLNQQINSLTNCHFEVLEKNIGRSAIRNLLAKKAKHKWLLFLDADIMPVSQDFISNYIGETEKNLNSVFLGGIAYKRNKDSNKIRWKLGERGEQQSVSTRNKDPFNYFFSANFLIEKEVFDKTLFDENIINYGCEDLLFAKDLEKKNIKLLHLNNPVNHLGIDENSQFIEKTKSSLQNLSSLIKEEKISFSDAKIASIYKKSMNLKIPVFLYSFIDTLEKRAIRTSSLLSFNLFRLAYLYKLFNEKDYE